MNIILKTYEDKGVVPKKVNKKSNSIDGVGESEWYKNDEEEADGGNDIDSE